MTIEYLADRPQTIPTLAHWQHDEWGYLRPGDTVEKRIKRFASLRNRDRIPMTVVALDNDVVLGSASLIAHDMETRMELTPWLAGVYVGEQFRRRGIAAQLVQRIMAEAKQLRVPQLYLYTVDSERLYAGLGWRLQEKTVYREEDVAIMFRRLENS